MSKIEELGKVYETDVLVVGGGMAGLPAGLAARETGAEVIIAEKGFTGLAGQAPRGGNGIMGFPDDLDYDEYEKFVCTVGDYLNDQEVLADYLRDVNNMLLRLRGWGAQITSDKDGNIITFGFGDSPQHNAGINLFALDNLRQTGEKMGIKFINHVDVTNLIKVGDKVCGAVGFDIYNGDFLIIKAKAVVVCCGGNGYMGTRMFTNNGEGNALSFKVGAQTRNAEFNFLEVGAAATGETIHGSSKYTFNSLGENIWYKYVHWNASDVCAEFVDGIAKEYEEGRGPVYVDFDVMENDPEWLAIQRGMENADDTVQKLYPDKLKWNEYLARTEGKYFKLGRKPEVLPTIQGNNGFIRVDGGMHTTVPGLFQAGCDTCLGSAIHGAAPLPAGQRGGAFMYCASTGYRAGKNAGIEFKDIEQVQDIPYDYLEKLKEKTFFGYKANPENGVSPRDLIIKLQNEACNINVILRKDKASLEHALGVIEEIKADYKNMNANDWHELMLCRQVETMALSSEISIKCGLVREESRNFHIRKEFPEKDNKNWLKWILADNVDGEIVISTEDVPIEKYKHQPED